MTVEQTMPSQQPPPKEKRAVTAAERWLLPVAFLVALLWDRMLPGALESGYFGPLCIGVFWLGYLALLYAFYRKRLARNRMLWYVAGCCAALCVWNCLFDTVFWANDAYAALTSFLVLPAVLMAHAVYLAGDFKLKEVGSIAVAWLRGWLIKPFTGIPAMAEATGSLFAGGSERTAARKAVLGVAVTLPLLAILIPLLGQADLMFGYHLYNLLANWNLSSLLRHVFFVLIAFSLFYSFLWNLGFGTRHAALRPVTARIDSIVCGIVLGAVTLLYLLFCGVQFTYLFARAGLPAGFTYSEYAREGFAQTVAVCAINLVLFGVFLAYGARGRLKNILLASLLSLTCVMLASGAMRLWLYIEAYGLTWLRVLSAWFILYLAAVVALCGVRMLRERLPAVAVSALLLLGWYVVLGFVNPAGLCAWYNTLYGK